MSEDRGVDPGLELLVPSTPTTMKETWYEVWADEGYDAPVLLILRPTEGGYEVLDPGQGHKQLFWSEKYDEARWWLSEDEFVRVGRKELDDP